MVVVGSHKEMSPSPASGSRLRKVRSVAVHTEDHVAGGVSEDSVRICCTIVQKLDDILHGGFGAFRLICRDGANGNQHRRIYSTCIEEQRADDLLDES